MALEVCRICGGNSQLKSILAEGPEMIDKLLKCANVQIFREDSLPNFVCQHCDQYLDLSYKLRKQSEETAHRLKKELNIENQQDVVDEASTGVSWVETATSSIYCKEEIKANLQCTSVPSSIQMGIETYVESSSIEQKPINFPLKIESSDIDEEEFQMIDNSNPVLANESNDAYEVYGSLEAQPSLITLAQNDIKIEEVKLMPPDKISIYENDANNDEELKSYLEMQQNAANDIFIAGEAHLSYNHGINTGTSPSEITSFVDNGSINTSETDSTTEESEDINLNILKSRQTSYTCIKCFQSFKRQDYLDNHVLKHHPECNINQQLSTTQRCTPGANIPEENYSSRTDQFHVDSIPPNTKTPHKCKTCNKTFYTRYSLTEHETLKHCGNDRPHKCNICLKSFQKFSHLTLHKALHLPPKHSCSICPAKFHRKYKLDVHMRSHTNQKLFKCKTCNKMFSTRGNLNTHKSKQHSDNSRRHKCDICFKSFKRFSYLTQHKLLHSKLSLKYSCSICPAKYRLKDGLDVHICIHSIKKPFKCGICSEEFVFSDLLKTHTKKFHSDTTTSVNINLLENDDSELINKDNKIEDSPQSSNVHISTEDAVKLAKDNQESKSVELTDDHHKIDNSSSNKEISGVSQKNTLKRNQCGYCDKQLKTLATYNNHLLTHIKNKSQWAPGVDIAEKNQCGYCGKQLKSSGGYQLHIIKMHPNQKLPYECKTCNKTFLTRYSLTQHETLTHSGNDRPHKCNICLKSFKHFHHLTSHKVVHLAPQHSCSICPAKFRNKSGLDLHMRIHTKATPLKCVMCSKEFVYLNSLKIHTKKFHDTTAQPGNINTLEKDESELINKDNRLDEDIVKLLEDKQDGEVVKLTVDHHKKHSTSWDFQKNPLKRKQCGYCGKQFKTSQTYKNHLCIHKQTKSQWTPGVNIPKKNQCNFCGKQLRSLAAYQYHIDNIHPNKKPLHKCETCNETFYTLKSLIRHERLTHSMNDKPYKCDICFRSFKKPGTLQRHKILHSDLPPQHSCLICPSKFRQRYNLNAHMRIHMKEKTLKCGICSEEFAHSKLLKIHSKKFHSDNVPFGNINSLEKDEPELRKDNRLEHDCVETSEYESIMCKDFSEKSQQQLPSTSKTQIKNTECSLISQIIVNENSKNHSKKFHSDTYTSSLEEDKSEIINNDDRFKDSPPSSNMHMSNKDVGKPAKDNLESEVELIGEEHKIYSSSSNKEVSGDSLKNTPKKNQCGYCGKQLKTSVTLKNHLRIHKQTKSWWTPGTIIANQCENCGKQLRSLKAYINHIKNIHPNKKPPLKCKTCNETFYTHSSLTQHETLTHSGNERPHKCDICLKSFKTYWDLKQHKVLHADLLQYSCSICPDKFRYKSNLNVHMRIHSKEKPFKCVLCSEEFAHSNSLIIHTKKFHSDNTEFGNINSLEKDVPEIIKDNRLEHDCAETFQYESNMCNDFSKKSQQQLPSTSKTQIRNTKCSLNSQNIVNENSKAISFALPMEYIVNDASNSSSSTTELNLVELIKVEEYQIIEQNVNELNKAELSSFYNIDDLR